MTGASGTLTLPAEVSSVQRTDSAEKPSSMLIRVELLEGPPGRLDPPPGREYLLHPAHNFAAFAAAIELGFRWDPFLDLHRFVLADCLVGPLLPELEDTLAVLDEAELLVAATVQPGDVFNYEAAFGLWQHRCSVLHFGPPFNVDELPSLPRTLAGWGTLPDQHGNLVRPTIWQQPPAPEPSQVHPLVLVL